MTCSPQRFLANDRNLFRDAIITASSVLPVENKVLGIPTARSGTAQARLTGTYTGQEQADYDIEIVDTTVEIPRVSAPTFAGRGSGTLTEIQAQGAQQTFTIECADAGIEGAQASVSVEGSTIKALVSGTSGNAIQITVDQSGLEFADTDYSLLTDLSAGEGGQDSPLIGQGFDWDSAVLDANGLIPTSAHRIAFGDDESAVYLNYKKFVDGVWKYYLVPGLARSVPKGTPIKFVTGGRSVTISDGGTTDLFTGIATAYDLLYAIRTQSVLVYVDGIVANDRSPTGQASRELSLRTDAHAEVSTGSGSSYAKGVEGVSVAADAGTQLVTLTCFATNGSDHPNARLGHELWEVKSSLLGDLGIVATGEPFNGAAFGFTIPVRLPPGYGQQKGRFSADPPIYVSRGEGESEPPICPVALSLGSDAFDQTITLTYVARPSGDCNCLDMPVPRLDSSCLGRPTEGGGNVIYEPETVTRLIALRSWETETVRQLTEFGAAAAGAPAKEAAGLSAPIDGVQPSTPTPYGGAAYYAQQTESLKIIVDNFEAALAQVDEISAASPAAYREAGETAWDAAFVELKNDIAGALSSPPDSRDLLNIPSDRYDARLKFVLISAGIPGVGKADASTVAGDGCWRDWGDARYWDVQGEKGGYMPLFSNHPYTSSRKTADNRVFSTHEFGLQLNIKCPEDLKLGDQVVLHISDAGWGATYQQGDELELPIVSAAPLRFTGGVDDSPVQTWNVNGSVDGPLPAYSFNPDSPVGYFQSGQLGFLLTEGGIPFSKGDRFRFAVEGGHYRWRKDGGAWQQSSPPAPIPLDSDVIDSGLSLSFTAGAASSFVAGDLFRFRALQPWAVSNLLTPNARVWRWDGATATVEAEFAETEQLDLIALVHTLPEGATATLSGGVDSSGYIWSEPLTWRAGVIWKSIDRQARFVRIEVTDATDGAIQFPWLGVPLSTSLSAEVQVIREFRTNRPGGNLQSGRFVGKAVSGVVSWTESALTEDDAEGLIAMLEWIKERNDEPILFIPQITRTEDPVIFARVNSDEIEFEDHWAYNQNIAHMRRVSVSMPLAGVLR